MATARSQVTKYLNISKLGKEISPDKKIKGEIAALVKKIDGSKSYAAVKWNNKVGKYVITYDPAPGMCTGVVSIFTLDEEADIKEESTKEDAIIEIVQDNIKKEEEPQKVVRPAKKGRPAAKKK